MPSMYDVAAKAGVAKTLVSRVINNQKGVSDKSRQKILQAMAELGYVPSAIARSLVLGKTNVIGAVLDSLREPYFFDLILGIEQAMARSNYDVLFCSGEDSVETKKRRIRFFSEGRADGVIIYGSYLSDVALINELSHQTFPFVVVENETQFDNINSVILDNVRGGEMAVEHLVSLDCRNIWHFTGEMGRTISASRKQGYLNGMRKHRLPINPGMVIESQFDDRVSYQQMQALLQNDRQNLPDAIFFGADITAFGAAQALLEAGVNIPGEIKLVGFDNDVCRITTVRIPPLTTLSQPLREMGEAAVDILLQSVLSPETKQARVFSPELVIRESTVGPH